MPKRETGPQEVEEVATLDHRPLFTQVRDVLFERIAAGDWEPGDPLPSEAKLATDYGVSLATMRKALKDLENRHLIVRTQGRGTFIAKFNDDSLQRFFKVRREDGTRGRPSSTLLSSTVRECNAEEGRCLGIPAGTRVRLVERLRQIDGVPVVFDRMCLPFDRFPHVTAMENGELVDQAYVMMQRDFGITVARTAEQIRAVGAPPAIAGALGIEPGTPMLLVSRTAFDLKGVPVEFRASFCRTDHHYYSADNQ